MSESRGARCGRWRGAPSARGPSSRCRGRCGRPRDRARRRSARPGRRSRRRPARGAPRGRSRRRGAWRRRRWCRRPGSRRGRAARASIAPRTSGRVVEVRPQRRHPPPAADDPPEVARVDVADVAVERRLPPGAAVGALLVDGEGLAVEELGRALGGGVGGRRQVEERRRHPPRLAGGEGGGDHLAAQVAGREVGSGRQEAVREGRQVAGQKRLSSRRWSARAAWKAPPLGRPGFGAGVQP